MFGFEVVTVVRRNPQVAFQFGKVWEKEEERSRNENGNEERYETVGSERRIFVDPDGTSDGSGLEI